MIELYNCLKIFMKYDFGGPVDIIDNVFYCCHDHKNLSKEDKEYVEMFGWSWNEEHQSWSNAL
jgi:hypothetical protein